MISSVPGDRCEIDPAAGRIDVGALALRRSNGHSSLGSFQETV
jgi:hypothetical protein